MPAILTHYVFAKNYINKLDDLSYLKNNLDAFFLGSQGADPLFFFGYLPKPGRKNNKNINSFGSFLHKENISDTFIHMITYASNKTNEEKEILHSYILGYLTHYLVDRNTHPYVFYNTGVNEEKSFYYHTSFESSLDVSVVNYYFKNKKIIPRKTIRINNKKLTLISNMIFDLSNHYNKDEIEQTTFEKSVKDMRSIYSLLYGRFGIKKLLFNTFLKDSSINSLSHPGKINKKKDFDYLNLNKNEWKHPSESTSSFESVIELLDKTCDKMKFYHEFLSDFSKDINSISKFLKENNNEINYNGVKKGQEMKHFNLYYNREKQNV